jgi:hypothetical protein
MLFSVQHSYKLKQYLYVCFLPRIKLGEIIFKLIIRIYLSACDSTVLCLTFAGSFCFLILYTVGRTLCTGDEPVVRPLPTHWTSQTNNNSTQTSILWARSEPTIPTFERAKAVHALDRAGTVIGALINFKFWHSINAIYTNIRLQ